MRSGIYVINHCDILTPQNRSQFTTLEHERAFLGFQNVTIRNSKNMTIEFRVFALNLYGTELTSPTGRVVQSIIIIIIHTVTGWTNIGPIALSWTRKLYQHPINRLQAWPDFGTTPNNTTRNSIGNNAEQYRYSVYERQQRLWRVYPLNWILNPFITFVLHNFHLSTKTNKSYKGDADRQMVPTYIHPVYCLQSYTLNQWLNLT